MTTECTFCTGTGVDPDGARCTWCDATGKTGGIDNRLAEEFRMDGVKRYHLYLTGVRECELGDYVLHSDALAREAALREGLAASRKNTEFAQESMQIFADEADKLQQRLTAAEQRSAELEVLLMNTAEVLRSGNGYGWEEAQADIIDAALKPTESGASDDDL